MKIDTALLTKEQKRELKAWEELFGHPSWQLVLQRFKPSLERAQNSYRAAQDLRDLGQAQGKEQAYGEIVLLEALVAQEFRTLAGDAEQQRQDLEDSSHAMA